MPPSLRFESEACWSQAAKKESRCARNRSISEALRFQRPGTLIGKALEPLDKGVGEILVLLSLQ